MKSCSVNSKLFFTVIDAFVFGDALGNPAAVFEVENFPPDFVMQNIATKLDLSATAFVKNIDEYGIYDKNSFIKNDYLIDKNIARKSISKKYIRWFAPKGEIPICGHATLASASIFLQNNESLVFTSRIGDIFVEKENDIIKMHFNERPIVFVSKFSGKTFSNDNKECEYYENLGISVSYDLYEDDLIYVAVFEDFLDVINFKSDLDKISKISKRALAITAPVYGATVRGVSNVDIVARYFAPKVGIPEDPVCGSLHTRITPFWSRILKKSKLRSFMASSRGGVLEVESLNDKIIVGGRAKITSTGEIL